MLDEIIRRHRRQVVSAIVFPESPRNRPLQVARRVIRLGGAGEGPRLVRHWLRSRVVSRPRRTVYDVFHAHGLPVHRFSSPDHPDCCALVKESNVDVLFNSQGHRLGPEILAAARTCCINRHTSALPRYRGVEPVVRALVNGDSRIGVTLHTMTSEYDGGRILAQESVAVGRSVYECYRRAFDTVPALLTQALARLPNLERLPEIDTAGNAALSELTAEEISTFRSRSLRYL